MKVFLRNLRLPVRLRLTEPMNEEELLSFMRCQ